ncbi:hypothetical protein GN956_G5656 [Arapaima gigas]
MAFFVCRFDRDENRALAALAEGNGRDPGQLSPAQPSPASPPGQRAPTAACSRGSPPLASVGGLQSRVTSARKDRTERGRLRSSSCDPSSPSRRPRQKRPRKPHRTPPVPVRDGRVTSSRSPWRRLVGGLFASSRARICERLTTSRIRAKFGG